jgi:hypothetical protein
MNAERAGIQRRRFLIIDREHQNRFIVQIGGRLGFYLVVFLCFYSLAATGAFALYEDQYRDTATNPLLHRGTLLLAVLVPLTVTFLCMFAHFILEAARVCGPLYRFTRVFESLSRGEFPAFVRIRKRDHLQGAAAELDRAVRSIAARIRTAREHAAAARAAVDALGEDEDGAPGARQKVSSCLELLEKELAAFDVPGGPENAEPETPEIAEPREAAEAEPAAVA